MSLRVTVLGCGASAGVPLIGCECAVCRSEDPRNNRLRSSLLIEKDGFTLLVDASPDLRQQALRYDIRTVDAILLTHAHADHCHGLDEVRSFNFHRNASIPLYADSETLQEVRQKFSYLFHPPSAKGWYRGSLEPITIQPGEMLHFTQEFALMPFWQQHGTQHSLGLRVDDFAYSTDVNGFPEQSVQYLENLQEWIVDCLRYDAAPTHAHLPMTLEWIEQFRPNHATLTHMSHVFDYEKLDAETPSQVSPAYDGLQLRL